MGQGCYEEQLLSRFPTLNANAFKGELTLAVAKHHFNLPTTRISKNDAPSFISRTNRFVGQKVPRFTTTTGTCDNEREWLAMLGVSNRSSNNPYLAITAAASIIQKLFLPGTFATRYLPRLAFAQLLIQQTVMFR